MKRALGLFSVYDFVYIHWKGGIAIQEVSNLCLPQNQRKEKRPYRFKGYAPYFPGHSYASPMIADFTAVFLMNVDMRI